MSKGKQESEIVLRTTLLQAKKTATGLCIPAEIVEQLGAGKKPPVKVTINGYTYRSSIAVMGGKFMLGVSADVREKAGVQGGDEVEVILELDNQPREVAMPAGFAEALAKDKAAKAFFETLSHSSKQRYTLPIDQAKTAETRQRRLEKAIADLARGKK